jgi:hypothetical protein
VIEKDDVRDDRGGIFAQFDPTMWWWKLRRGFVIVVIGTAIVG